MLLDADRSQLLVVDVQARLLPAMSEPEAVLASGRILLAAAGELGLPVTVSEQYPAGLGQTVPEFVPPPGTEVLAKTEFSCLRNRAIAERLAGLDRPQLVVLGIEAHVCVLQTVVQAVAEGFTPCVVADGIASRRRENRDLGLARMRAAGATVISTEMAVFEWLGSASAPAFRTLSRLVR